MNHPDKSKFDRLKNWMSLNGGDTSKLELRYNSEDERGVHAAKRIKAGETVLFLPCLSKITL